MWSKQPQVYNRCHQLDAVPGEALVWVDAHPDFHSNATSISGFIGGKALHRIRKKYETIYILGARDIEPGELDNIRAEDHVHLVSDVDYLGLLPSGNTHVHIDGDVLDPLVNPDVAYPARWGYTVQGLANVLLRLPVSQLQGWSVSNMAPALLDDLCGLLRSPMVCCACGGPFDLETEGGQCGTIGTFIQVAFCPTCFAGICDMVEQMKPPTQCEKCGWVGGWG